MSLLDPTHEWVAVQVRDLRAGDTIVRQRGRGPVVQSIRREGTWTYVSYCGSRGGEYLRSNASAVVDRGVRVPA